MPVDTVQVRSEPWALWITANYSGGKDPVMLELQSIRCHNTSPETIRAKATTGRGPMTKQHTMLVAPGEDKTLTGAPFPIVVAGSDLGIAVEPV